MCYGPEFVAKAVREWIAAVGARTAYIAPGKPMQNGYVESFNGKMRDEHLRPYVAGAPSFGLCMFWFCRMFAAWQRH